MLVSKRWDFFVGGTVLQGWDLPQKHAAFPTRSMRLIREAFRQLALCAHEEAKAPSALRAQGVSPRCRLKAPDGNSAIVFAVDSTPAVLPSHST